MFGELDRLPQLLGSAWYAWRECTCSHTLFETNSSAGEASAAAPHAEASGTR